MTWMAEILHRHESSAGLVKQGQTEQDLSQIYLLFFSHEFSRQTVVNSPSITERKLFQRIYPKMLGSQI